jgi:hypothetical protein
VRLSNTVYRPEVNSVFSEAFPRRRRKVADTESPGYTETIEHVPNVAFWPNADMRLRWREQSIRVIGLPRGRDGPPPRPPDSPLTLRNSPNLIRI